MEVRGGRDLGLRVRWVLRLWVCGLGLVRLGGVSPTDDFIRGEAMPRNTPGWDETGHGGHLQH